MIKLLLGILLLGSLFILFIPRHQIFLIRFVGNATSFFTFFVSLFLWILFDDSTPKLQFVDEIVWLSQSNINFTLGVDGISLFFILLTTLLIPIDTFKDDYYRVDVSLKQQLPKNFQIYANLNNLNGAGDKSYQSPTYKYPTNQQFYGFTMDLGVRYKF